MGNEKYINYYIETLTNTLTDAFLRNVSLQANAKVNDEVIQNLSKQVEDLTNFSGNKNKEIEELKNRNVQNDNDTIKNLQNTVNTLQNTITNLNIEIATSNKIKNEYENLKSQVINVDTFRTELIKERELHQQTKNDYETKINELKQKIELLETPPKKKKAKSMSILEMVTENEQQTILEDMVKDGGSF